MRSTAPFAVSAAPSRVCGRWLRAPVCRARRFGYSNDAAGRRTAISRSGEAFGDLSGSTDAYGYNSRSEVVSARRTKGGASVRGFDEDFSYDPIGNRIATTNYTETGSAIVSQYEANNLNQYTSRTVPGVAAVRGFADANATVTVNENPTWRLGEYFFGSDEFDNSQSSVDAALVTTAALASPTNGPDEVASVTSRVHIAKTPQLFEYDLDGNQTLVTTKTGTWRVKYNGENRPVRWERLNSSTPSSITPNSNTPSLITMSFDHQGRRRLYLETAVDGSTNHLDRFTYDNYLCVARNRWSPDGTSATDRFVWDPTEPVATRPLAFYQPNVSPQLYAHDGNKNVSELVSVNNGTITAHYEYASFGEVILSSGDLAIENPFRFSSEYADETIALVYYNYRHLDPVIGRWLCRDPSAVFEHLQIYYFCANDAVVKTDIIGLIFDECEIGDYEVLEPLYKIYPLGWNVNDNIDENFSDFGNLTTLLPMGSGVASGAVAGGVLAAVATGGAEAFKSGIEGNVSTMYYETVKFSKGRYGGWIIWTRVDVMECQCTSFLGFFARRRKVKIEGEWEQCRSGGFRAGDDYIIQRVTEKKINNCKRLHKKKVEKQYGGR